MGTIYKWTGDGSNALFGLAANWLDTNTGTTATVPPQAGDTAMLDGTGTISGTGTVSTLDVQYTTGGGFDLHDFNIDANTVVLDGTLGLNVGTLTAGNVRIGHLKAVGYLGIASATLTALGSALDLTVSGGQSSGENCELYLASGGVADIGSGDLVVGSGNLQSGLLNVSFGGEITGGAGSRLVVGTQQASGYAGIDQSTVTVTSVSVGTGSGYGRLALEQNAILDAGDGSGTALLLGNSSKTQAFGRGAITSNDSTINLNGAAFIGQTGTGSLSLFGGTLTTLKGVILGDAATGQGIVNIEDASWTDHGNVNVGVSGFGTLILTDTEPEPVTTIRGALLVGVTNPEKYYPGAGQVTLTGLTLRVTGTTELGLATSYPTNTPQDDALVQSGADWNSTGASVDVNTGTLTVTGTGSTLSAGTLAGDSIGVATIENSATATLGSSLTGTALTGIGALTIYLSTVTATGTVQIAGGPESHGLLLEGDLSIDAKGVALSTTTGANLSIGGNGAALTTIGEIAMDGGYAQMDGANVTATANGAGAMLISGGSTFQLYGSPTTLTTHGLLSMGNAAPLTENGTGFLDIGEGSSVNSMATSPGGVAVAIGGSSIGNTFGQYAQANVSDAVWTITGAMDVGTAGFGSLDFDFGGAVLISAALDIGTLTNPATNVGSVSANDTVIAAGATSTAPDGLSAESLVVAGNYSALTTTTLEVGEANAAGTATILGATVTVTEAATIDGAVKLADDGVLDAGTTLSVAQTGAITGQGTLQSASLVDLGKITASSGTLTFAAPITGTGEIDVTKGGTALFNQSVGSAIALVFSGAGTLSAPSIADIASTIKGWFTGDEIDFTAEKIASDTYAGHTLSLFDASDTLLGTETFAGTYTSANFTLTADQGSGTFIKFTTT